MMSKDLIEEFRAFFYKLKLSNYEINVYITLLNSKSLTAREISRKSGVPRGRIYDVLEDLRRKGIIEIADSRPKIYTPLTPNIVLNNLISHIEEQNQNNIMNLYNQAKFMETRLQNLNSSTNLASSKIFWSTAYGMHSIESLYIRNFSELKKELLLTGFLNQNTIKILPLTIKAHEFVLNALNRGVKVYYLWSLEFIDKELLKLEENKIKKLIDDFIESFNRLFNLTTEIKGFELRFTSIKIPTYYDIFDVRNIIFKLRDPLNPWQIFASMNVFDPNLAENLREKFFNIWQFKSFNNFDGNNFKEDIILNSAM